MIELNGVDKIYYTGDEPFYALRNIHLSIEAGEILVILGQSGSGKSTLMNLIAGLDQATNGSVHFQQANLSTFSDTELEHYRRVHVGFIFQTYNLIPNLTVGENIELGAQTETGADEQLVDSLMHAFELDVYRERFPYQLSGGGKQRVAVARALAKQPQLLVCDEPTGALDEKNAIKVIQKLQEYNAKFGTTIVFITHNPIYAKAGHRAIYLNNGSITKEVRHPQLTAATELAFGGYLGGHKHD
jgi:putative ABC transport system ATP-binding protein